MSDFNDWKDDDEVDEEAEAEERYGFSFKDTAKDAVPEPEPEQLEEFDIPSKPEPIDWNEDPPTDLDFSRYDCIFSAKSAGEWIDESAGSSAQKQLFGDFWRERELAVLFADTGVGKSVLATQIAESIASGVAIEPFAMEAEAQRVLLFDFEMEEKQFEARYSATDPADAAKRVHYQFSPGLIRITISPDLYLPEEYKNVAEYFIDTINDIVEYTRSRILIIDNITWLGTTTDSAKTAMRLMKQLKHIKAEHGISILVLAHTPKRYRHSPVTVNDLQGSKMFANFADSIFAFGASRLNTDLRYLKQLKSRNTAITHGESNVATLRLDKMPGINPPPEPEIIRAKHLKSEPGAIATGLFTLGSDEPEVGKRDASKNSPPYKGGVAPASGDGVVLSRGEDKHDQKRSPAGSPPYKGGVAPASGDGVVLSRGEDKHDQKRSPAGSPPYQGGVAPASGDGVVLSREGNKLDQKQDRDETPACFLGFALTSTAHERDHIGWFGIQAQGRRQDLITQAQSLAQKGLKQREIAKRLGISEPTVCRYLKDE